MENFELNLVLVFCLCQNVLKTVATLADVNANLNLVLLETLATSPVRIFTLSRGLRLSGWHSKVFRVNLVCKEELNLMLVKLVNVPYLFSGFCLDFSLGKNMVISRSKLSHL